MPIPESDLVSALISELSQLNAEAPIISNEDTRKQALKVVKKLTVALEKPQTVPLNSMLPVQSVAARIALDLNIFSILKQNEPTSISSLSVSTGAEPALLTRILRVLDCMGWVKQVENSSFQSTAIGESVKVRKPVQAGMKHLFDIALPVFSSLPAYFKENGYKVPKDENQGPFQYAFKTDLTAFDWWSQNPEYSKNFNTYMEGTPTGGKSHWVNWFPVQSYLQESEVNQPCDQSNDNVLVVDIGGGRGQDLDTFIKKFPNAKGRFILEDLPSVVEDCHGINDKIECEKYNFFDTQPIKGARIYHLHNVLHNWPDDAATDILSKTAAAMTPGYSRLFIVENCLPERDCAQWRAEMDWWMLALHCGSQRTMAQFQHLCQRAGLEVIKYWAPPGGSESDGVVEIMKPVNKDV